MKPIFLLSDEPEAVRLMLDEVTSGRVAVRESEARAGCNCDRWGHPLCGVSRPAEKPNESRRSDFLTSQTAR
jgi:hypothetical protein